MSDNNDESGVEPLTPQFRPEEFFPVFMRMPQTGDAVICGGQAVNLLALVFLSQEELVALLGEDGSATSTDMDIVISKELQEAFSAHSDEPSRRFTLKRFPDARQPISFSILPDDMPDTRIDVLKAVKGIHLQKDKVFEDAISLDAVPYKVMNPITLMIAKAENCASLEQDSPTGRRNDLQHLRMLVPIVHHFIRELVAGSDPASKAEQRDIIGQLKKLQKVSKSPGFIKGCKTASVRLWDAVPTQAICDSPLETLKSYFTNTFVLSFERDPSSAKDRTPPPL